MTGLRMDANSKIKKAQQALGRNGTKAAKKPNGFTSSPSSSIPTKAVADWGPDDVRLWLEAEGFADFWPVLQPHDPNGIDLLMLNPDDWQSLLSSTNMNNFRPNVLEINRLFFKVNRLKLTQGLPLKYPKLSFCLTGNPIAVTGRATQQRPLTFKTNGSGDYSQSTDDDLDADLFLSDNRKGSLPDWDGLHPIENPQEVAHNGVPYRHDSLSDTDLDDEDEANPLDHPGHNTGAACPFCHNEIKREKSPILPERWKALLAFVYALAVSWVTAFVMVIVHDRVPDMEKYPPLPDILLDNIPHIPWAFEMCEFTGMILMSLWFLVLLFHKHRFILMRRFFSISGTIFLLRCVTMLITSLSVPGKHLDCSPRPYGDIWNKMYNAYIIWTGAGMTLQGVRTCGDYMFSGHTVALTLLNFFITEYTSRKIYFLHTLTWICNVFGIFFILAAHEHYSIDVFVAFYITSRLFMYYHTLANQPVTHSLRKKSTPTIGHFSYDAHRTWLWFPMFSFFENKIDGKIPNEFAWPVTPEDLVAIRSKILEVIQFLRTKMSPEHNSGQEEKLGTKKFEVRADNYSKGSKRNKKKIY